MTTNDTTPNIAAALPMASTQATGIKIVAVEGGEYYFKPGVITVKKGDTVQITLISVGGKHDFVIDEFSVISEAIEDGEFEYYCLIGERREHGMVGTLVITE